MALDISTVSRYALWLDKNIGNILWKKSLDKERKKVKVLFKSLNMGNKPPTRHKKRKGHCIFNTITDLPYKEIFITRENLMYPPHTLIYSRIISRYTIRIILNSEELNDL